jgi:uncharacterized membrane protein YqjE
MSEREPYPLEEPDRSLGELVGRLTNEVGELVGTHVELAKVEVQQEIRKAGRSAGILGGGMAAGYLAAVLLSFAAAWGLAEVMAEGVAFLLVGLVWLLAAWVLGNRGRRELQDVHATPQGTIEELQEDRRWMRQQVS